MSQNENSDQKFDIFRLWFFAIMKLSVLNHVTDAFPPAFVMTAEGDFLAEQARPLVERLHRLGAEAEYHYYGDRDHVLGHVFHCDIRSEAANRCNREECEFFKRHLNR